jgi:serine/threonine-protein kinase
MGMSQRFIRCRHCGLPHHLREVRCSFTGRTIRPDPTERAPGPNDLRARQGPSGAAGTPAPSPQRGDPTRALVATTIGGKYLVRSVLGEGGMGTVYEAEHIAIGRSVAVKVLHSHQAKKKDAIRRFHQEARAACATLHPNICEVYDLGALDDGRPYLVMEKLVGETLADRIACEGGLPFEDVVEILVQVLSGLIAAHEKGVVHRDIKPENVFLTRRVGCPPLCKLLDFGVSKVIGPVVGDRDDDLDLTRTGMVMGTPYYMSPEQARGDRNLDERVDLYACGVLLYEVITGRRPFSAANYNALLIQVLSGTPTPARELRPALPSGFDPVLAKAMARDRERRYRKAAEFQRDLQALRDRSGLQPPARIGEALRALSQPRSSRSPPVRVVPSAIGDREAPPARVEPSSSSIEIPITFSNDTPASGESRVVRGKAPTPSDAMEFEDYPTQVQVSPCDEAGPAPGPRDTDVTGLLGVPDTDPTGKPAVLRGTGPDGDDFIALQAPRAPRA